MRQARRQWLRKVADGRPSARSAKSRGAPLSALSAKGRRPVFGTARNVPQFRRLSAPPDSAAENLPKIARFRSLAHRPPRFESARAANSRPRHATGRDPDCGSSGSQWPRKVARASPPSRGSTLPDLPRECRRTSAGTTAAIAQAFPPWRRTPKPLRDQKYRAAARLQTCPNDARSKIALRLLLQASVRAAMLHSPAPSNFLVYDFPPAFPCPCRAAAARKSAGRGALAFSIRERIVFLAHRAAPPMPASVQSCAANVRPPYSDDKNRAPPANRSRAAPAGFPSISPVDAWAAAPYRDSPPQEFLSACPSSSPDFAQAAPNATPRS